MEKLLFLVLVLILLACKKTETVQDATGFDTEQTDLSLREQEMMDKYGVTDTIDTSTEMEINNWTPTPAVPTVYNFVVFETISKLSDKEEGVVVSGIFESTGYMSEEEKYRKLDELHGQSRVELGLKSVKSRFVKSYGSYSEASRARESYLGIASE